MLETNKTKNKNWNAIPIRNAKQKSIQSLLPPMNDGQDESADQSPHLLHVSHDEADEEGRTRRKIFQRPAESTRSCTPIANSLSFYFNDEDRSDVFSAVSNHSRIRRTNKILIDDG